LDYNESFRIEISVIVCTYNRANLLAEVLETLCKQTIDKKYYEVIVVDNNSKDKTASFAKKYCQEHSNFRYCLETMQGLSNARNHGWKVAKGKYIAYIDDDCRVPKQWLATAMDIIRRISPGVFGGPFYAFYKTSKPRWYKDSYASHVPFKEARVLGEKESVNIFGGNMFFRKKLLKSLGGFDSSLGMSGKKIAYGEETEILQKISSTMPNEIICYDPSLYVHHLVQKKKMKLIWIARERFVMGAYMGRLFEITPSKKKTLSHLVRRERRILYSLIKEAIVEMLKRNNKKYLYFENFIYEQTFQHLKELGKHYGIYKYSRDNSCADQE